MKRLLLILSILLLASIAHAEYFVQSNINAGAEAYQLDIDGTVFDVVPEANDSMLYSIDYLAAGTNIFKCRYKLTGSERWSNWSDPLADTKPGVPSLGILEL